MEPKIESETREIAKKYFPEVFAQPIEGTYWRGSGQSVSMGADLNEAARSACVDAIQEALQHAPSSPAAPTPHMTAAEFYREVWVKENGSDPRGDWPIRMAEAYAIYRLKVAEAYAASETVRADRAERELDRESAAHLVTIDDRDTAQDALAEAHRALGGDGEWVAKLYPNEPGESGDLRKDVPVIAAEIFAEATSCQERLELAEADLQRKDAAARALISEIEQDFCNLCAKDEGDAHKTWCPIVQLKAALGPISVPPKVMPSPCCANPNMVVKGVCGAQGMSGPRLHWQESGCLNWRPTHNVCLNCGKEEKI